VASHWPGGRIGKIRPDSCYLALRQVKSSVYLPFIHLFKYGSHRS
jgi:hypothetical protein